MYSYKQKSATKTILLAGLISGLLDATAGVVIYWIFKGLDPFQVLQYIASGVFGPSVINGSFVYVIIGLILHFIIAYAFTISYYFAFPRFKSFAKNTILNGLIFGGIIWIFMNYVVLPNSNIPKSPKDFVSVIELVWHVVLVGLPMVLIIEKKLKD